MNGQNINKCCISVKCDPEDLITSAVEDRLQLKSEELGHV